MACQEAYDKFRVISRNAWVYPSGPLPALDLRRRVPSIFIFKNKSSDLGIWLGNQLVPLRMSSPCFALPLPSDPELAGVGPSTPFPRGRQLPE